MARSAQNRRASVALISPSSSYCRVAPPDPLSPEKKFRRIYATPRFMHGNVGYSSLSEAALAALSELLIPNFTIIEGTTYQIPLSNGASIDFMINGVLIEYHEPRLRPDRGKHGDFRSMAEYNWYRKALKQCGRNQYRRENLVRATRQKLTKLYTDRRQGLLMIDPLYRHRELVVASSVGEFYEKVIQRFCPQPPAREEFDRLFWWWVKMIARENKESKRRLASSTLG